MTIPVDAGDRAVQIKASSAGVTFSEFIDPAVVESSTVLSTVAEAKGDASLPSAVKASDFRLWMTMKKLLQSDCSEWIKDCSVQEICNAARVRCAQDRPQKNSADTHLTHKCTLATFSVCELLLDMRISWATSLKPQRPHQSNVK